MTPATRDELLALAEELGTVADQLERQARNARLGGHDCSVRVKDPEYLIDLLRRARTPAPREPGGRG